LLHAGKSALGRLREKALTEMRAGNQHELMRALEVVNMIENGELIFRGAMERKETRGKHNRVDYPFTNPLMEKLLVLKRVEGTARTEWREMKRK
jgi:succinate dehydrogenase/fumarate reductase flavoprotein subunit